MTQRSLHSRWLGLVALALAAALLFAGPAWAQQAKSAADEKQAQAATEQTKGGPVVRTLGTKGGYQTEVTTETKGTLSEEDRQQVALLTAQVFEHIDEARKALDAEDTSLARKEVDKGRQAIRVIRTLLPKTRVHTKTTAPDGLVIYEDQREVQDDRVPLFEGMLSTKTLAPIAAAKEEAADNTQAATENKQAAANPKQEAAELKGVRLIRSETITTQVFADLDLVEAQLNKVAKALDQHKIDEAAKALAVAQVRGVEFRFNKEDTPLAEARDAMWLAKRSLEENNATQARANLTVARQSLQLYREIAPQERRKDVDQMLKEVDELEAKLGQETAQHPASSGERKQQGHSVTSWWERINQWFRRR